MHRWLTSRSRRNLILRYTGRAVVGFCTVIFIKDNVFSITDVYGFSMSPTLSPRFHETGECDHILWNRWLPTENIQRGDIIVFRSPTRPEDEVLKRVIALEGDRVILDPRRRPQRQRDGADVPESRAWDALMGTVEMVPKGHVWVEGDNWRRSVDSNHYGPISKSLIGGKAVAVVWPWNRFWTTPWTEYKSRTKVIPGKLVAVGDDGLAVAQILEAA